MTNYWGYGIIKDMYSQNENELIAIGERIGKACKPNQVLVLSGFGCWENNSDQGFGQGFKN